MARRTEEPAQAIGHIGSSGPADPSSPISEFCGSSETTVFPKLFICHPTILPIPIRCLSLHQIQRPRCGSIDQFYASKNKLNVRLPFGGHIELIKNCLSQIALLYRHG